jgi:hypothetical protein
MRNLGIMNKVIWRIIVIEEKYCFLLKKFFYYYCAHGPWWYLQKFIQYIVVEFAPFIILLYRHSPFSWNCFNRSQMSVFNLITDSCVCVCVCVCVCMCVCVCVYVCVCRGRENDENVSLGHNDYFSRTIRLNCTN